MYWGKVELFPGGCIFLNKLTRVTLYSKFHEEALTFFLISLQKSGKKGSHDDISKGQSIVEGVFDQFF